MTRKGTIFSATSAVHSFPSKIPQFFNPRHGNTHLTIFRSKTAMEYITGTMRSVTIVAMVRPRI